MSSAGADDDERLAVEEPHLARLKRCVADLVTIVHADDPRRATDPEPDERLRRGHLDARPILDRHRHEAQVLAVTADARPVGREYHARRRAGRLYFRRCQNAPTFA